jgi:hypothetical protein
MLSLRCITFINDLIKRTNLIVKIIETKTDRKIYTINVKTKLIETSKC